MKILYLLRHAKSSWDDPSLDDFERPLNARGVAAASGMGAYLEHNAMRPSLILSSTARRTRETTRLVSAPLDAAPLERFDGDLYLAGWRTLLAHIHRTDDDHPSLMLVGHNPGMEMLAANLADPGQSDRPSLARLAEKYPTAALAVFEIDAASWADVAPARARLRAFIRPKDIMSEN